MSKYDSAEKKILNYAYVLKKACWILLVVSFSHRIRQCFVKFHDSYCRIAIVLFIYVSYTNKICSYQIPRFDLCHVLSSSTNNFAHAQALYRMSSLCRSYECMNIVRVNIGFFTGFKKKKQRRISFVLGYLRMILWKISTAISIKHRILATFNIAKNQFWQPLSKTYMDLKSQI